MNHALGLPFVELQRLWPVNPFILIFVINLSGRKWWPYEKLMEAGSFVKAKEKGWVRTEGKDYIVKDGDVIEFLI